MASNTVPKTDTPQVYELENANTMPAEKADIDVDADGVPLDPETLRLEKRLKLKLDFFILPLITMVYFFASMVSIRKKSKKNKNVMKLTSCIGTQ